MDIKKVADKAKGALDDARAVAEGLAEKAVDKADELSGGKVPQQVRDAVDRIDGRDDELPQPPEQPGAA